MGGSVDGAANGRADELQSRVSRIGEKPARRQVLDVIKVSGDRKSLVLCHLVAAALQLVLQVFVVKII
jgi:hypothetical protein